MSDTADAVIVGGGFSGTMLAVHLAARGVRALLIEQRDQPGRGVAYGTHDAAHLLNVPAGKMSGWPERPDDFAAFAGVQPGAFVARQLYGDYLAAQGRDLPQWKGTAVAARRTDGGWRVELADGRVAEGRQLVLAMGNGRPKPFDVPGLSEDRMLQDPWGPEAKERLAVVARCGEPVLLIGTGLTMVDMMLGLQAAGHEGAVTAVSRRGLVPRAHASGVTPAVAELEAVPDRLSDALAWLRARGGVHGWRAAVDGMRPVTQAIWARWPDETRTRFLRHARPWWDVHRHRIAPDAAALLAGNVAAGRLRVMAGRVRGFDDGAVRVWRRGGGEHRIEAGLVVNCTGPVEGLAASRNVLVQQMLDVGLIAPGPMGLGVAADANGRVEDDLWALGPMVKGVQWEITAVPDIRMQVEKAAASIAKAL